MRWLRTNFSGTNRSSPPTRAGSRPAPANGRGAKGAELVPCARRGEERLALALATHLRGGSVYLAGLIKLLVLLCVRGHESGRRKSG